MKTLLSYLYGSAIRLRNFAYDRGMLSVERVDVPVISVGNITAGGTGKTPLVEFLTAHFLQSGRRPAIVTRGYGRSTKGNLLVSDGCGRRVSAREGGDEAVQIARKFETLIVIADEVRSRGCRKAVEEFGADILILDDAFQHRAQYRNTDVVVIDATQDFSKQRLLPAGRLREPLGNLRRADIVVLSKCDAGTDIEALRRAIAAYTSAPVFAARYAPRTLYRVGSDLQLPLDGLAGMRVGSFCGIGNPVAFGRTLKDLGIKPELSREYPDHHWFSAADISELSRLGREKGIVSWITTEKDAVRLMDDAGWKELEEVYYPGMEVEFMGGSDEFFNMLAAEPAGKAVR